MTIWRQEEGCGGNEKGRRGGLLKRRRAAAVRGENAREAPRRSGECAAADGIGFLRGVGELVALPEFLRRLAAGFAGIGHARLREFVYAFGYPALFEGFFDLGRQRRIWLGFAGTA